MGCVSKPCHAAASCLSPYLPSDYWNELKPCRFAKCLCVRACLRLCVQTEDEIEAGADDEEVKEDTSGPDFNYLLSMPMWFLTKEKKEELCRQRDAKVCILKGSDVVELRVLHLQI